MTNDEAISEILEVLTLMKELHKQAEENTKNLAKAVTVLAETVRLTNDRIDEMQGKLLLDS